MTTPIPAKDRSWTFFISPNHSPLGFILFASFIVSFIIRFIFITNPELIRSDEPYYALWGQYFLISTPDHPAFIGYMIKPFIALFGNNRFAYTLPFYLMMLLLTGVGGILLFQICRSSILPGVFFMLSMTLIPYFAGISVIVSTETPLIFFAFLAIFTYFFAFFKKTKSTFTWLLGGFFLAMALFSKLTALFVIVGIFSYPLLSKNRKQHFKNYRLYLSVVPIIIMGAIILIDDYHHDFWLIRYTLSRSYRPFSYINQWDKPLGMIFSQFNIFSPLIVILIPLLLTRSFKNYFSKDASNSSNTKKSLLPKEQNFFFAATGVLPILYALYKIATTFLGSYWTSFAYPSMLLLCCFYLAEKWQQGLFRKKIFLNYFLCFLFIVFVYFHTFYGVVDPNFNPQNPKQEKFLGYNNFMSGVATFFQKNFGQIPADNTDRYYDYSSLVNEFPDFYQNSMKKDIPILSLGYSSAAIVNFFNQPKIPTAAFSPITFPNWNQSIVVTAPSLFDYIYDFSSLNGKEIYLIVENNDMPLDILERQLKTHADQITLIKTFSSYRKGKFLRRYLLFHLTNFKHTKGEN